MRETCSYCGVMYGDPPRHSEHCKYAKYENPTNPKLAKTACHEGNPCRVCPACIAKDAQVGGTHIVSREEAEDPRADGWCIARHDKHGPCVLRLGHDGPHDWARHISHVDDACPVSPQELLFIAHGLHESGQWEDAAEVRKLARWFERGRA